MNKKWLLFIAGALLTVLVGCASNPPQDLPPVVEPGAPDTETGTETYPADVPPAIETAPEAVPPAPVPSTNSAVQSLINQSRAQYNARDYQAAIATAERGLRIDRRSADLYLLLAQSYVQLSMPQQAAQFAQQGLRYSQSGSVVADALQRVKQIVAGGL